MPELPEVETVCRGLRAAIIGRHVDDVILRRAKIRIPIPADFTQRVQGAKILTVERRAKYLIIGLDTGYSIVVHLGMSGRMMVFSRLPETPHKHDHVYFLLNDGRVVVFNDPRRFGLVTGCDSNAISWHPLLRSLGPEPLAGSFSAEYLYSELQKRKQAIKPVLMDQKLVVGVGNIYVAEALFRTKINPECSANLVSKEKCKELVARIKDVLSEAIVAGGSTLRDYVDSAGESGYFQHRFAVYGREGESCLNCHTPVTRITQAKRSTFYCAICQK